MKIVTDTITLATSQVRELVDITAEARRRVSDAGISDGVLCLYAHGATAAIMVQENADPNIGKDVVTCLEKLIPDGAWLHDRVDGNGAAHIQAGLIGPSETIPVRAGRLDLSTWQNVFFCELDGPRTQRIVKVTVIGE